MKKFTLLFLLIIFPYIMSAQDWGIRFNGFVKTDAMFDTRQNVTAREGHFLLFPMDVDEVEGGDVNETMNFNMLSIQSRITGKITAPDFLGAKTTGMIEGAFFGHTNSDINGFRLRHATLNLDWGTSELLIGQYWTPLFIDEAFAKSISFNTGTPFQPFARNPQIRYTFKADKFHVNVAAYSERDFASTGPDGETSTYLRNAVLPVLNFGLKYNTGNMLFAANANYKSIRPRLLTEKNHIDENKVNAMTFNGAIKYYEEDFFVTLQGLYGQNTSALTMLGGYAVTAIDESNGMWEYTPLNTFSGFIDMEYGKVWKIGFLGGYTMNLGADKDIVGNTYGRGANIDNVLRISPRLSYRTGMTQFSTEFEVTQAAYGTRATVKGVNENTHNVMNIRVLLAAILFF
ncbi:MAG: hypothetical protein M9949_03025 [Candidatus Kapabacteria bacterium]|nr:hypothetical protein [Candidatus Kapabacteria bacterium]